MEEQIGLLVDAISDVLTVDPAAIESSPANLGGKMEELTGSEIGFYHYVEADQTTLRLQA